jgi:hypothetical protein
MFYNLTIDPTLVARHPEFHYLDKLFESNTINQFPARIDFKPGVNIICGENGTGKTSIIKILRLLTFTVDTFHSDFPNILPGEYLKKIMYPDTGVPFQRTEVPFMLEADYSYSTFNLRTLSLLTDLSSDIETFEQYVHFMGSSGGERTLHVLSKLFDTMFNGKDDFLQFPISSIESYDSQFKTKYLSYFMEHHIPGTQRIFSVLMDEPDLSLDIHNMSSLYDILSVPRDDTQIIAVVHNPLLLYRLSQLHKPPHFIETSLGYIGDIIHYIDKVCDIEGLRDIIRTMPSGPSILNAKLKRVYKRSSDYAPGYLRSDVSTEPSKDCDIEEDLRSLDDEDPFGFDYDEPDMDIETATTKLTFDAVTGDYIDEALPKISSLGESTGELVIESIAESAVSSVIDRPVTIDFSRGFTGDCAEYKSITGNLNLYDIPSVVSDSLDTGQKDF